MTKPYFPPPGGEQAGYREAAPKPLDVGPPASPLDEEQPAKRNVRVTRPDDPDVARAKAESGTAPTPAPTPVAWLLMFVLTVAILVLVVAIQLILALRSRVGPMPTPVRPVSTQLPR